MTGSSACGSACGPFGSADARLQNRPSVLPPSGTPYDQRGTHHPHKQTPRWAKCDGSRRWAGIYCHNLGGFHGSLNRKCSRAPACPWALALPMLIESPYIWLALCTYQLGFRWFDQQFKIVFFFFLMIIIIKKKMLLWSICTNISAGDDLS